MTGLIYIITCTETHKVYVGQTRDTLEYRFRNHLYEARAGKNKSLIYRAIRKYGESTFHISLLEELLDCTIEQLNEREIYWIAQYRANNREYGYNLTEGGGGCKGLDIEIRQHLSEIRRGKTKWSTDQKIQIAKRTTSMWANLTEQEYKDMCTKISVSQKGRKGTRLGAINSPEHRAHISASRKGQPSNNKGRKFSEEHKRKIGEANSKPRIITEEEHQKRREAALRRHERERSFKEQQAS